MRAASAHRGASWQTCGRLERNRSCACIRFLPNKRRPIGRTSAKLQSDVAAGGCIALSSPCPTRERCTFDQTMENFSRGHVHAFQAWSGQPRIIL
jgi:hypothetical protein